MKKISAFLSENFQFLVVKFSIYLNRRVFVMGMRVPSNDDLVLIPDLFTAIFKWSVR